MLGLCQLHLLWVFLMELWFSGSVSISVFTCLTFTVKESLRIYLRTRTLRCNGIKSELMVKTTAPSISEFQKSFDSSPPSNQCDPVLTPLSDMERVHSEPPLARNTASATSVVAIPRSFSVSHKKHKRTPLYQRSVSGHVVWASHQLHPQW